MSESQQALAERWLELKRLHAGLSAAENDARDRRERAATELANATEALLAVVGQRCTGTNSRSRKVFRVDSALVLVCSDGTIEELSEESR